MKEEKLITKKALFIVQIQHRQPKPTHCLPKNKSFLKLFYTKKPMPLGKNLKFSKNTCTGVRRQLLKVRQFFLSIFNMSVNLMKIYLAHAQDAGHHHVAEELQSI